MSGSCSSSTSRAAAATPWVATAKSAAAAAPSGSPDGSLERRNQAVLTCDSARASASPAGSGAAGARVASAPQGRWSAKVDDG